METTTNTEKEFDFAAEFGIWPSQDRLVILPQPQEEITAGGIIIPDTAKEKPVIGMVIVAGPGYRDVPQEYAPGDHIMHSKYAGTEIDWNGVTYLVMRAADVIARVDISKRMSKSTEGVDNCGSFKVTKEQADAIDKLVAPVVDAAILGSYNTPEVDDEETDGPEVVEALRRLGALGGSSEIAEEQKEAVRQSFKAMSPDLPNYTPEKPDSSETAINTHG